MDVMELQKNINNQICSIVWYLKRKVREKEGKRNFSEVKGRKKEKNPQERESIEKKEQKKEWKRKLKCFLQPSVLLQAHYYCISAR
jgi:hypothetical protein